ncbi:HalOD1 output domain-containing protein [Halosimplex pelagicum]|uniref:Halobacterial output domain-containing protein n=1 Tax=Halosimplex pelagicum TaxID=869886 RepID=A0A7D5T8V6_9EURY|nr:HalOD1 output domain-containing protein [Halosimplex pelagicum]QLH81330.1 hypothetical protein HZS54_06680 [Halosimplex pelagicum]
MDGSVTSRVALQRQYDCTETPPSHAIVAALATIKNCSPAALVEPRLSDHIDPDALNQLVRDSEHASVSFSIERYQVQIDESELTIRLHDR